MGSCKKPIKAAKRLEDMLDSFPSLASGRRDNNWFSCSEVIIFYQLTCFPSVSKSCAVHLIQAWLYLIVSIIHGHSLKHSMSVFQRWLVGFGYLLLVRGSMHSVTCDGFCSTNGQLSCYENHTMSHSQSAMLMTVIYTKVRLNFRCTILPSQENWLKINEKCVSMILGSKKKYSFWTSE